MCNTIHFYRNLQDRSVLVTADKLIRNPFSFQIAYIGDLKTMLTVSEVRNMLKQGVSHADLFDNHRYVAPEPSCEEIPCQVTPIYIYQSPGAQGGVKVTTEQRPQQVLMLKVDVAEESRVKEVLRDLREKVRVGYLIEDLREEFG